MPFNTTDDVLAYTVRMRARGDSYPDIKRYFKPLWPDDKNLDQIIDRVREMEKNGLFAVAKPKKTYSTRNLMIGGIIALLGFFLMVQLGNRGWVSGVPFLMIGGGLIGMLKKD